jgi:L-fuculose-phosphate aldolase
MNHFDHTLKSTTTRGPMEQFNSETVFPIVFKAVAECLAAQRRSAGRSGEPDDLFHSPEVHAIKEEIVRNARKLWEREYVDGNGGNLSARISSQYVICTPTMCSKGDLRVEDLSLVDLENGQICGSRPRTSEILLHLEIYKAVPKAKAVIHCHPPYSTAHAIAGVVPQGNLLPEQEVFVGPVALTPYETPGTIEFARTIIPVARQHNTILLENHGVVSWADTVTHAEWCIEVIETYCKTIMIASQLRPRLKGIPSHKIPDLLAIKKKLGMPDARLPDEAMDTVTDFLPALLPAGIDLIPRDLNHKEMEQLAASLTNQIVEFFNGAHGKHR